MGGTFNPVHYGHIEIAKFALQQYELDKVWFMPNKIPAYKTTENIVAENHRVSMIKLAIEEYEKFEFSSFELMREGFTYTYETLQLLNKKYPDYSFYFIMGADSLITFSHWKNPDIIAANCIILAALRDDIENVQMDNLIKKIKEEFSADIFKIKCNKLDISSKDIRRLIKNNDNVSSMLPDNVLEYIKANKLYN